MKTKRLDAKIKKLFNEGNSMHVICGRLNLKMTRIKNGIIRTAQDPSMLVAMRKN